MATDKKLAPNIDNSDPANFPNGRIKDNTGAGDGTPVNRLLYSDLHEFFAKLMRLAGILYNGVPDSEDDGYQLVDAAVALAGKNDYLYTLSLNTGVIGITTKLGILQTNELLLCKAGFDHGSETTIKGSDAPVLNVTFAGSFKNGDYLRLQRTGGGVTLTRLADSANLDVLVTELNYLKAATDAEEFAGTIATKATTPYTNQLAFTKRVNGDDSNTYLASSIRNGLMSAADKATLDGFSSNVKNTGWISGIDVGGGTVGSHLPTGGNITDAVITLVAGDGNSGTWRATMQNAMADTNYFVRMAVQSQGSFAVDTNILTPVFQPFSTTQFDFGIDQSSGGGVQSLKIHFEVVQY